MHSSSRVAIAGLGHALALLGTQPSALQAQIEALNLRSHELEAFRRKRHLETVAKREHPKPKGRGRAFRAHGLGGFKARVAFWQRSKAKNWHEALAELGAA